MSRNRRILALPLVILAAVVTVLAGGLTFAPGAGAQQPGNIVTFGDSYTSNPDQLANFHRVIGSSGLIPDDHPETAGCLQSPDNWPRQMSRLTGIPVDDYSCTAETSASVLERVDVAIGAGALHPGTRAVYFAVGANDFGPYGLFEGNNLSSRPDMQAQYVENMLTAAGKVRRVAPDAQLIIAGMPQMTNGTGVCLLNVVPGLPLGIPVPGHAFENAIRETQRAGAQAAGMDFVDNYAMTAGHDSCSTDDSTRYVAGLIDTTSPEWEFFLHPTVAGSAALAHNNSRVLN